MKLKSDGFVEAGSSRSLFSSAGLSPVLHYFCDFSKQSFAIYDSLSRSEDFRWRFLFADVIFPWFGYANITLGTVALDTPNNVAAFVTYAPAKRTPMIWPLSKSEFFHTDCDSAESLMHWHEHYRVWTNGRTFTVASGSSFIVASRNSVYFLSVSIILSRPLFNSFVKGLDMSSASSTRINGSKDAHAVVESQFGHISEDVQKLQSYGIWAPAVSIQASQGCEAVCRIDIVADR
jgi:hypothetical protein